MESFNRLSSLQQDFLSAFFRLTDRFYLTGGAALVGVYGLPRNTKDLDLFTCEEDGLRSVHDYARQAAKEAGAELEPIQTFTTFRRYLLKRGDEVIEVDFVHELAPQLFTPKARHGVYIVDPLEEIFANKLCALVGRSEIRDLWDIYQLVQKGFILPQGIEQANQKDAGVDLESVILVLSSLNWQALGRAASRAGYSDWAEVENFYASIKEQLAMELLPDQRQG